MPHTSKGRKPRAHTLYTPYRKQARRYGLASEARFEGVMEDPEGLQSGGNIPLFIPKISSYFLLPTSYFSIFVAALVC